MSIEITIIRSPGNVRVAQSCQIFTEQGGTIGRAPGNTWTIEDPEKFISSKHSQIVFENGYYYLLDLSTNGTFYNGAREPIGSGNRVVLKDGDKFTLGDYEFLVSMNRQPSSSPFGDPFGTAVFAGGGTPASDSAGSGVLADDPFAATPAGVVPSIAPLLSPAPPETDPLAALDRANRINGLSSGWIPSGPGVQPDNVDPLQQAVNWPNAIPEDWDSDEAPALVAPSPIRASTPAAALPDRLALLEQQRVKLEQENRRLREQLAEVRQQLAAAATNGAGSADPPPSSTGDAALIEAMGLAKWNLPGPKQAEITRLAGELVRECLCGLMEALTFRKKIKEEFRINVTTIQPVENNPLKFSANIDDALENMFVRENKAYKKPLEAVREGFHGISEHQLAVLAGIQAAFRGMLERLDPGALEQRFEKYRKAGVIKVGQKGKNWDAYKEFHQELVNNMDNSFQHLFAYDFVQAYEDQLQRLLRARKAGTPGPD